MTLVTRGLGGEGLLVTRGLGGSGFVGMLIDWAKVQLRGAFDLVVRLEAVFDYGD